MSLDFTIYDSEENELYWKNITHNLSKMAQECGLHKPLWCAYEYESNSDIINDITKGIENAIENRCSLEKLNPENGWGRYEGLLLFAYETRDALIKYPDGEVSISK
jgi:hypothetical protein